MKEEGLAKALLEKIDLPGKPCSPRGVLKQPCMARATAFPCLKKGHASWKNENFQLCNVLYALFLSKSIIVMIDNEHAAWAGGVHWQKTASVLGFEKRRL